HARQDPALGRRARGRTRRGGGRVKPPPFDYATPTTIKEALALVRECGGEARFLAGGQSLVPLLNMRFARPSRLVDLNRIPELQAVEWVNGHVRIGAMA